MKKNFADENSKAKLAALFSEIANLRERFPCLVIPRIASNLLEVGGISIDERPWDTLVLIGYFVQGLWRERSKENMAAINRVYRKADGLLRWPANWMYEALTPEVQSRYQQVAGEEIPQAVAPRMHLGCGSKYFEQKRYEQLVYMLNIFTYGRILPEISCEVSQLLVIRGFVYSMEKPNQGAIDELNKAITAATQQTTDTAETAP